MYGCCAAATARSKRCAVELLQLLKCTTFVQCPRMSEVRHGFNSGGLNTQLSLAFRQNTQLTNVLSEGLECMVPSRRELDVLTTSLSGIYQVANSHVVQCHDVCWLLLEAIIATVWLMQIVLTVDMLLTMHVVEWWPHFMSLQFEHIRCKDEIFGRGVPVMYTLQHFEVHIHACQASSLKSVGHDHSDIRSASDASCLCSHWQVGCNATFNHDVE